jgi:oxygen-independent coproporphyrinogen-3 oxidase
LPIIRGLTLSRDDILRRSVIMAIMCQGELIYESIELGHLVQFKTYFAKELALMSELAGQGLVEIHDQGIKVTASGWYFVRAIAMVFDKYLQSDKDRARFSKII